MAWTAALLVALLSSTSPAAPPHVTMGFEPIADVPDFPLDLETALALAGGDNPPLRLAREAVRASWAEQLRARALLLPTLNAGASFNSHSGTLQSAQGVIQQVNRQSLYSGAGAFAVGAG